MLYSLPPFDYYILTKRYIRYVYNTMINSLRLSGLVSRLVLQWMVVYIRSWLFNEILFYFSSLSRRRFTLECYSPRAIFLRFCFPWLYSSPEIDHSKLKTRIFSLPDNIKKHTRREQCITKIAKKKKNGQSFVMSCQNARTRARPIRNYENFRDSAVM